MDNEIEKIIEEQIVKLPKEVVAFISSASWDADADEIGSLYNLSQEELAALKNELTLVLVGLTHPDELSEVLEREVGLQGAVLEAVVKNVSEKIFKPIRPALIDFFESEDARISEAEAPTTTNEESPTVQVTTPSRIWEKTPDIAPDNLPTTEETEPLFPPIPEKNRSAALKPNLEMKHEGDESESAHPFEEKMKRVFTGGQQSMGNLTIEAAPPQISIKETQQASKAAPLYHADPYREAIE